MNLSTRILYILSRKILFKYRPDVIGIVGSVGKTAAKEAAYAVLTNKFKIRKNIGIYNNDVEIILTVLGLPVREYFSASSLRLVWRALKLIFFKDKNYPDILLLEIDVKHSGELSKIMKYIPFRISAVVATGLASISAFNSVKQLAVEQETIVNRLTRDDIAILNIDDELIDAMKSRAKVITCGIRKDAYIKASEPTISLGSLGAAGEPLIKGISFKVNYQGSIVPILLPGILGVHQIYSALIAIGCGLIYQLNLTDISESLQNYQPPPGRMRILPGIKNSILIDDTYGASPLSTKAALKAMSLLPLVGKGETYAVIGDILDLGGETEAEHRRIGHYIAELGINKLITIGERSSDIAAAAREAGMREDKVFSFSDIKIAGGFIQNRLEPNDIVLIKGSSAMKMENVTKELMADPARARRLLVQR